MLNHTELKDRVPTISELRRRGIISVHFIAVQFGLKNDCYKYLKSMLGSKVAERYDKIDYCNTLEIENLEKWDLFTQYKCALFAIVKARLILYPEAIAKHYLKVIEGHISELTIDDRNQIINVINRVRNIEKAEKKQTPKRLEADKRSSLVSV